MVSRVWAMQGGTPNKDGFRAVQMGSDGSSVSTGGRHCHGRFGAGNKDETETGSTTVWTAVKQDADGEVLWTWQDEFTGNADDKARTAVMGQDGGVVIAGTGSDDFQVIKLDANGTLEWRFQEGTSNSDRGRGIAMDDDGSVVVVGSSLGEWDISMGSWDMVAFKLDADGTLLWKWQDGTIQDDKATGVAMSDDGTVVLSGYSGGEFMDAKASVSNSTSSSSVSDEFNFVAVKLDSEGAEVWRWQDGSRGEENLMSSVSMTDNGSFVMVGRTEGIWSGVASAGGVDFVAVILDADGNEISRWQDGTPEDDELWAVVVLADGTIVFGGNTKGDWSGSNAGGNDFAVVSLDADLEEVWRWQDGSAALDDSSGGDYVLGMSAGINGTIALAGQTYGSYVDTNLGDRDFVAVMLDTGGVATPPPTKAPSPSPAPFSPPSLAQTSSPAPPPSLAPSSAPLLEPVSSTDPPRSPAPSSPPSPARTNSPAPPPSLAPSSAPFLEPVSSTDPPRSPAPSSLPSPARTSSDSTLIMAVVVSSVAAVALFVMGCVVRKRQTLKPGLLRVSPVRELVVEGITRPQFPANPLPLLLSHSEGLVPVSAANDFKGGEDIEHLVADTFAGAGSPSTEAPPRDSKNDDARGGLYKQGYSKRIPVAKIDGAGGIAGRGAGGGVVVASVGDMDPATHAGTHRGGIGEDGLADVGENTGPTSPTGNAGGGGGLSPEQADAESNTLTGVGDGGAGPDDNVGIGPRDYTDGSADWALSATTSTVNISTAERNEFSPANDRDGVESVESVAEETNPAFDENKGSSSTGRGELARAVGEAALELARNSHIAGVSQAAEAVSILVNLLKDDRDNIMSNEASLRRCRSIVVLLKRATKVLGKGSDTTCKAERDMMEDVHDAIFDLVELIKTYQSRNRIYQLLVSTLFRRRQDEMGAVVDRAISSLQLGLHVQVGNDVTAVKQDVGALKQEFGAVRHDLGAVRDGIHVYKGSMEEAHSQSVADARRTRRRRTLDQIEIPEDQVVITDELLGKGGFGEVFLADYNGRNAAAKVMYLSQDPSLHGKNGVPYGLTAGQVKRQLEGIQRKTFLRELGTMLRLRSPYTVNIYGAVTCLPDRLILVMELLAGGDLRTLLSNREHQLGEQQSRQLIGDICAGMSFLHSKETVHGDLKSANVLLDGAGRAKIGDFGTSIWTNHNMSTGLATFTTASSKNTQMSLAWSAPEVLHAAGSTYASDVYSFGIVVWEVLSRELPWSNVTHPREIYIRVALNDLRPTIPDDAPAEIADMATACWVSEPGDRPMFSALMDGMKASGWKS